MTDGLSGEQPQPPPQGDATPAPAQPAEPAPIAPAAPLVSADSSLTAPVAPATATALATAPRPAAPRPLSGRRYGFLCTYCSSRLEAVESMAGQSGTCPTCGNSIVIPILDYRGRLIDPTSGDVIKQDPHPVHAYAAAGHKAPQIVAGSGTGNGDSREPGIGLSEERFIKCPRCSRNNLLSANNCAGCGLPFTMEGTVGDAVSGTNTWAVASLVLGIVSLACGFFFVVPPILAIIFGGIAMRSTNQATGQTSGSGLAIAGIILGTIGLVIAFIFYLRAF